MVRKGEAIVTPADRKEREKKQRRSDIINAAEKLFFSRGYDNVSMNDIASEVELSKATLYLYFKDKESLFFAIVLRGAKILNAAYTECSKLDTTGIEKIKAMGQGFYEFTKNYPDYFRMLCYSGSERFCNADNDDAKKILELTCDNIELISKAFKEGIDDGTVRSDLDPLEMAIYLCVSRLSVLDLDPRWKIVLQAGGISYDRFLKDFRRFISPSIVNRRDVDAACEDHHE
jgi:TetR/AcrR family transcriptional regulator